MVLPLADHFEVCERRLHARAAVGLLALALLLTSLDREDVDLEGLAELVRMWRARAWQKNLKKQI